MTPRGKTWTRLRRLLVTGFVVLSIYWTALFFCQRLLIFPRDAANSRMVAGQVGQPNRTGLERFWLDTEDGRTECWLQLADGASEDSPAGLVLFAHGNAELIDGQAWVFAGFRKLGYSVAMCEYRGYGRSDGSPSQADITKDQQAMLTALLARPEVDRERVIFFGRSIGTGVACALAQEHAPAAILLLSPFRSLRSMARGFFAPEFLVRDPFDNQAFLGQYPGPVLLMHGTSDQVIPIEHSKSLEKVAANATLRSFDCGHNNVPVDSDEFWQVVQEFLTAHELQD